MATSREQHPTPVQTVSVEDRAKAAGSYRVEGDTERPFLEQPYTGSHDFWSDPTGDHRFTTPWARDGQEGPPQA